MAKIAPKGEIFGAGQVLNKGLPGKNLAKNVRKDNQTLNSLGVKNLEFKPQPVKKPKLDLFQDTGKLAFKTEERGDLGYQEQVPGIRRLHS